MAFLAQDDKQLQPGQDPNAQVQAGQGQSGIVGGSAEGATVGGQPVSTAGVGAGGAGGWTNIQAYLGANKGNEAQSAGKLNSTVGSQFTQEKDTLNKTATETKAKANEQLETNRIGQDQASQMIQKMGSQYKYPNATPTQTNPLAGPTEPDDYEQNRSKFQSALTAQYKGPESYTYGLDGKTQQYGSKLSQDDTFKGLMGDIYNEAAGGKLARGGRMLQNQLDNGNEALTSARANLLNEYTGLSDGVVSENAATNKAIDDARTGVVNNREGLRSNLSGMGNTQYSELQKALNVHYGQDQAQRKAEGNIYWETPTNPNPTDWNAGKTGQMYYTSDTIGAPQLQGSGLGGVNTEENTDLGRIAYRVADAQKSSQNVEDWMRRSGREAMLPGGGAYPNAVAAYKDANNYYDDPQMSKYIKGADETTKGIGDQARGSYNSILDVLGMNTAAIRQNDNMKKGRYVMAGDSSDQIRKAGGYFFKENADGTRIEKSPWDTN